MKVIITRPQEDAALLSFKLKARGHQPIILPLLNIVVRSGVEIPQRDYQAICLTSANAVRVLARISALKDIPVLAVGPQSMQVAIDKGFLHVTAQGGDVIGLHNYILNNLKPEFGPLLYLSGAETSGDLEGKLQQSDFVVDRVITYDAQPSSLAGHQSEIISANAVVLYSPRSAKLWVKEITALNLEEKAAHIKHVCLSANVAACLPQSWPIATAQIPQESALLSLLD